ncbi:MAG: Nif3-like dinuclear metal center hexameric protein [Oscillospiraceae bacterium]|nr:Nif3-like dinuclear metal center hexameric protein [Oscillospiraceae bacterium]
MSTVKDIFSCIDEVAPFCMQEGYDNSGLVISGTDKQAGKVLVALDITKDVALEAMEKGVDVIVSHHPVIFKGLKHIEADSPVGILLRNDISAVCAHTNFDSAILCNALCEKLDLAKGDDLIVENGVPTGCICECEEVKVSELAKRIKEKLGCQCVRYSLADKTVSRIAVCNGSGGSFLPKVIKAGCDCYITGDVKHDVFVDAYNEGLAVIDAGHFHTENLFCDYVKSLLVSRLDDVEVSVAQSNRDILSYEI